MIDPVAVTSEPLGTRIFIIILVVMALTSDMRPP
jgi:hypothetical protein